MTYRSMVLAITLVLMGMTGLSAHAADNTKFEIVKATEDRVWRLNKETGEIAVCTLDGEYLLCTTTSASVDAPQMSYEEWEKKKAIEAEQKAIESQEKKERTMAMFDKIIELFRSMMASEVGQ